MPAMLKRIEVIGLYEVFNHPIQLKDENITLILGENGLGKTLVLKMINAFFAKEFHELYSYHFKNFILTFLDDTIIQIDKIVNKNESMLHVTYHHTNKNKPKIEKYNIQISQFDKKRRRGYHKYIQYKEIFTDELEYKIRHFLPFPVDRISPDNWIDPTRGIVYSTKELINNYKAFFPDNILDEIDTGLPNWLVEKTDSINTMFIETQRLLTKIKAEESEYRSSVIKYSQELVETIKNKTVAATDLASTLDRSYPNRVIDQITKQSKITDIEIEGELNNLTKRRDLLNKVGLLDTNEEESLHPFTEAINKQQVENKNLLKDVLQVYINDSNEKLSIYDDLAPKLDLLLDIINKRFLYKELSINKKNGFAFKSLITNKDIPLSGLSSGEQHELVLFYQLLFKTIPNSLLLIDEPEISLHITWQNHFIEDLRDVIKLNNFYAIIATHSPDIINNNWDLTIQLKGVEL